MTGNKMAISRSVSMSVKRSGLIQVEFGKSIGRSRETISAWCNGRTVPDYNDIKAMADLCGVKPSVLLQWGE